MDRFTTAPHSTSPDHASGSSATPQPANNSAEDILSLSSPPPIISSSSRLSAPRTVSKSPPLLRQASSSTRDTQMPVMMEMPTSVSTSSIQSSPFHQPSSRRLFHDTPTSTQPKLSDLVSPIASGSFQNEAHTPTAASGDRDVFGKIDHTPLRQETHSTSPLPNSRSLQMGDMLDHVLDSDQFQRLSVGNIIAPERASSKKPQKRLPTDPHSTTASPTPLSRSALTSMSTSKRLNAAGQRGMSSSPASDPFTQRPAQASSDELSLHVKNHMAALQQSPQTY